MTVLPCASTTAAPVRVWSRRLPYWSLGSGIAAVVRLRQVTVVVSREDAVRLSWVSFAGSYTARPVPDQRMPRPCRCPLDDVTRCGQPPETAKTATGKWCDSASGRRALRTIRRCPGRCSCCRLQRRGGGYRQRREAQEAFMRDVCEQLHVLGVVNEHAAVVGDGNAACRALR